MILYLCRWNSLLSSLRDSSTYQHYLHWTFLFHGELWTDSDMKKLNWLLKKKKKRKEAKFSRTSYCQIYVLPLSNYIILVSVTSTTQLFVKLNPFVKLWNSETGCPETVSLLDFVCVFVVTSKGPFQLKLFHNYMIQLKCAICSEVIMPDDLKFGLQ